MPDDTLEKVATHSADSSMLQLRILDSWRWISYQKKLYLSLAGVKLGRQTSVADP